MVILAHLMAHGRLQRRGQRLGAVEDDAVSLHVRDAPERHGVDPIDAAQDLDLPDVRKAPHDRRMARDVMLEPDVEVLGRPRIMDEEAASRPRRRRRSRDLEMAGIHRLLGGLGAREARPGIGVGERLQMPLRRDRRLELEKVVEVKLQTELRRRPVGRVDVARDGGRVHLGMGERRRRRDKRRDAGFFGSAEPRLGRGVLEGDDVAKAHLAFLDRRSARTEIQRCLAIFLACR